MKKTVSIILAVIMLLSVVPFTVSGASDYNVDELWKNYNKLQFVGNFTAEEAFEIGNEGCEYNEYMTDYYKHVFYRNNNNTISHIVINHSAEKQEVVYELEKDYSTGLDRTYTEQEIRDTVIPYLTNPDLLDGDEEHAFYIIGDCTGLSGIFSEVRSTADVFNFMGYYSLDDLKNYSGRIYRCTGAETDYTEKLFNDNEVYVVFYRNDVDFYGNETYSAATYCNGGFTDYYDSFRDLYIKNVSKEQAEYSARLLLTRQDSAFMTFSPAAVHVIVAGFTTIDTPDEILGFTEVSSASEIENGYAWEADYSYEDVLYSIEYGGFEMKENDAYIFLCDNQDDEDNYRSFIMINNSNEGNNIDNKQDTLSYFDACFKNREAVLNGMQVEDVHYLIPVKQTPVSVTANALDYGDSFTLTGSYDPYAMAVELMNDHKADGADSKKMEIRIFNNKEGGISLLMYFDGKVGFAKDSRGQGQYTYSVDMEVIEGEFGANGFIDLAFSAWWFYFDEEGCNDADFEDFKITVVGDVTPYVPAQNVKFTEIQSTDALASIEFSDIGVRTNGKTIDELEDAELIQLEKFIKTIIHYNPALLSGDGFADFIVKLDNGQYIVYTIQAPAKRSDILCIINFGSDKAAVDQGITMSAYYAARGTTVDKHTIWVVGEKATAQDEPTTTPTEPDSTAPATESADSGDRSSPLSRSFIEKIRAFIEDIVKWVKKLFKLG